MRNSLSEFVPRRNPGYFAQLWKPVIRQGFGFGNMGI
jgi:hypothetical protein